MSEQLQLCPLCESSRHRNVYVARDWHYGNKGTFRVERCEDCTLMFLNPMFTDQELTAFYPDDYYAYQNHFESHPVKETIKRLLGLTIQTRDPKFAQPGNILDVGCGSGWFLRRMRDQGWQTFGVEVSSSAVRVGREKGGLDIFCGTLPAARFQPDFFDYVRLNHSFEHIASPHETLDEIHRILKPDGKLMIGVPNLDSLNARLFGKYWWYLGVPVHPYTYAVQTLSRLLAKHRFEVEKVTYNADFSGILGSFQIWLNRNSTRKSTEGAAYNNPLLKVGCHWLARVSNLFRLGDAIEITTTKRLEHP